MEAARLHEIAAQMKAIRRISSTSPQATLERRLEIIAGVAQGKIDPQEVFSGQVFNPKPAKESKSKRKAKDEGLNRGDPGGFDREA